MFEGEINIARKTERTSTEGGPHALGRGADRKSVGETEGGEAEAGRGNEAERQETGGGIKIEEMDRTRERETKEARGTRTGWCPNRWPWIQRWGNSMRVKSLTSCSLVALFN